MSNHIFVALACVCMYVRMVITLSRVWINRVWLPILLVVSWTGKMSFSLSPVRAWEFGLARRVRPSHPASARSFPTPRLNHQSGAYLRDSSRIPRQGRHSPSISSTVIGSVPTAFIGSHIWRTDGVHCRESSGTGPVALKVVRVTGASLSAITMDPFLCASLFPHPILGVISNRMGKWEKVTQRAWLTGLWEIIQP